MESVNHENIGDLKHIHIQSDQSSTNSIWMVAKNSIILHRRPQNIFVCHWPTLATKERRLNKEKSASKKAEIMLELDRLWFPYRFNRAFGLFYTNTHTHFTFWAIFCFLLLRLWRRWRPHLLAEMVHTFMHTSAHPEYASSIQWWYCFVSLDSTFGALCAHKIENCQRN